MMVNSATGGREGCRGTITAMMTVIALVILTAVVVGLAVPLNTTHRRLRHLPRPTDVCPTCAPRWW